jgi:two-component system LytT family response regulator
MSLPEKNESISVLLVDDEKSVRAALKELLHPLSSITIVGEAASIPEAVKEIHLHKPDLIFLDIEMPGYTGLQLLEFFNPNEVNFDIIFVTAFNEYAIQAFKVSAFDYLLKPVNQQELEQTLQRYMDSVRNVKLPERVNLLKEVYAKEEMPSQIAVSSLQGIDFVQLDNIILFEASGTYTNIILRVGEPLLASKPLGEFELVLQKNPRFFRAHRSYLINLKQVRKLSSKEGDVIIMEKEIEVPLSRYRKKEFEQAIAGFKI